MTDLTDMTAFRWDVLFVLLGGDDYGLGIKQSLEQHRDEDIHHGRLYPNLDWLCDQGLIEKSVIDRRTNSYELTDAGRDAIEDRLQFIETQAAKEHVIEHRSAGDGQDLTLRPRDQPAFEPGDA